jgi:nucleoside-diphosphate-sugar epimerase
MRRRTDGLPDFVQACSVDLAAEAKTDLLPDDVAYAFFILTPDKHNDVAYYRAYISAQRHFLHMLQGRPIKRYFFISSTSVFGQSEGEWVDESSPVEARNFASRTLIEAEQIAWQSGLPATVVRFGGIYGPGRTHLIDMVLSGKAHCMEGVYSNRIHVVDAARMLAHLRNLEAPESLYVGVDNAPAPLCEVYEWLAEQLSVPLQIDHREPTESARQVRANKRIRNTRIRSTGFEFRYPTYREGYGELITQLLEQGHLG